MTADVLNLNSELFIFGEKQHKKMKIMKSNLLL